MFVAKKLLLALLVLPLAELLLFILVAKAAGLAWALLLVLGSSVVGAVVLRGAESSHLHRFRATLGDREFAAMHADSTGILVVLAGILLLIPGFITSALGIALFVTPFRRWLGATLRRALQREPAGGTQSPDAVVDLTPGEWRQVPEERLTGGRDEHGGR